MLIDIIKSHVNMIILHIDVIYFACGEQENATIDNGLLYYSRIKYQVLWFSERHHNSAVMDSVDKILIVSKTTPGLCEKNDFCKYKGMNKYTLNMKICKCDHKSKYEPGLCSDTIPGGSWLLYEVELLQVSDQGIDLFDELDVDQNEELTLEEVFHWIFTESFCFNKGCEPGFLSPVQ